VEPIREELAWAGGLFEGEGTFYVKPRPYGRYAALRIHMSDEDVIRRFADIFGLKVLGPYRKDPATSNFKNPPLEFKPWWTAESAKFETVQAIGAMLWPWLGKRRREQFRLVMKAADNRCRCDQGER